MDVPNSAQRALRSSGPMYATSWESPQTYHPPIRTALSGRREECHPAYIWPGTSRHRAGARRGTGRSRSLTQAARFSRALCQQRQRLAATRTANSPTSRHTPPAERARFRQLGATASTHRAGRCVRAPQGPGPHPSREYSGPARQSTTPCRRHPRSPTKPRLRRRSPGSDRPC